MAIYGGWGSNYSTVATDVMLLTTKELVGGITEIVSTEAYARMHLSPDLEMSYGRSLCPLPAPTFQRCCDFLLFCSVREHG